ncbi:hypothetical protein Glove_81g43 [Diversispora epigaea]|uniref:Uncharacterized protein n=1 Tax=Diversispora epigaea TaxID=1348612 RepID=A0A397J8S2_9GLOM|nr:hypothetical protein Glove_81g43 [Diversispora epigaea]
MFGQKKEYAYDDNFHNHPQPPPPPPPPPPSSQSPHNNNKKLNESHGKLHRFYIICHTKLALNHI